MHMSIIKTWNDQLAFGVDDLGSWTDQRFGVSVRTKSHYAVADHGKRSGRRAFGVDGLDIRVGHDEVRDRRLCGDGQRQTCAKQQSYNCLFHMDSLSAGKFSLLTSRMASNTLVSARL